MPVWFNWVTWGVFAFIAGLNLAVLVYATHTRAGAWLRPRVLSVLRTLSGRSDLNWLDWQPVLVAGLVAFAAVSAYGILSGQYGCHPPGVSDPIGVLNSGKAFWAGTNPFTVSDCGGHIEIPYGLAAVLFDALGSLGGLPGIYVVWGLVSFSVLPLTWAVAGKDRRQVLLFVGTSALVVPLISSQIDGATNAIVPVTVLLSLYLAGRNELLAAAVGGFLSTARFPNLFPILGGTGSNRRYRYTAFLVAAAVFGGATVLSVLVWHGDFLGPVFLNQVGRRSFSLNFYGVFLLSNALPSSVWIEVTEAALTVALVLAVFVLVRSPIGSVAIVLVGFTLLTPFLSFNILVYLLPVALAGVRARWWLWSVALVGSLNYDLAYNVWALDDHVTWPSAIFDVVLTVLLLALFVELWRQELRPRAVAVESPA
ncbi:MAG: hypothetical protein ABSB97_04070 [Thermoplasmata archaeon]|jgi:hypothetical protein